MNDEINIVGKLFDFGVWRFSVFDREGMKLKNIEQDAFIGLLLWVRAYRRPRSLDFSLMQKLGEVVQR
jgi:hypothetical protein